MFGLPVAFLICLTTFSVSVILHDDTTQKSTTIMHQKGAFGPIVFSATGILKKAVPETMCERPSPKKSNNDAGCTAKMHGPWIKDNMEELTAVGFRISTDETVFAAIDEKDLKMVGTRQNGLQKAKYKEHFHGKLTLENVKQAWRYPTGTAGDHYQLKDITLCPQVNDLANSVVLIRRGGCNFLDKAFYAQEEGALAVIIGNNVKNEEYVRMSIDAEDSEYITIPAVFITYNSYQRLLNKIGSRVTISSTTNDNVIEHTFVNYGFFAASEYQFVSTATKRADRFNDTKSPIRMDVSKFHFDE